MSSTGPDGTPLRYAVYARTAAGGAGAAARQLEVGRAAVAKRGDGVVVQEFRDVNVPGNGQPGPGLVALLEAVSTGEVDVVVVTGLGRLARSAATLEAVLGAIEKGRARVITALEER